MLTLVVLLCMPFLLLQLLLQRRRWEDDAQIQWLSACLFTLSVGAREKMEEGDGVKGHKNLCKFSISENCFSSSLLRASSFTAAAEMIILRWRMGWKLTFHCLVEWHLEFTVDKAMPHWRMSADWSHDEMTRRILANDTWKWDIKEEFKEPEFFFYKNADVM